MRAICDLRRGNERKRLGLVAKVTLFACLIWGLRFVPSGCLAVYPGPVMNLSAVIEITEYPPRDCSFYMVSVLAEDASMFECIFAALDGKIGLWSKSQVFGEMQPEEYMEKSLQAMAESQRIATYVALMAKGIDVPEKESLPIQVVSYTNNVAGPSAGLAFALEIANRIGDDMIRGRRIACTGVLTIDGKVSAVGGIAQKTIACEEEGIEIFLVPKDNYDEAVRFSHSLKVVGVSSLEEAIEVLTYDVNP